MNSRAVRSAGIVAAAIAFRWLCFAVMTVLAVWNESFPGRRLDDPVLAVTPYLEEVHHTNYWLWLLAWIPGSLALLFRDRSRFVRLMIAGGLLSVLRGICIVLVPLGPVRGEDRNLALEWTGSLRLRVIGEILDPLAVFVDHTAHVWLTKDLFFSGHTATTFLLLLYVWPHRFLRWVVLILHTAVVASLFFGHIHYTIDVVAAYAAVIPVYLLVERSLRSRLTGPVVS